MQNIALFDLSVTRLLSEILPHTPFTQAVFSFLSFAGGSFFVWLIPFILLVIFEQRRDHEFILYFALSSLLTTVLVNYVLKDIFMRTRPYLFWGLSAPACPHDYSFPSGHAAFSFAAATILGGFDRKRKWWYFTSAFLISYSRIFLFCHYFFDVLTGGLIGYMVSAFILRWHHLRKNDSGSRSRKQSHKK